jgi:hypothetical protein
MGVTLSTTGSGVRHPAAVLLGLALLAVSAQAFEVLRAATEQRDGVYYLDADLDYQLGLEPLKALSNGVPIGLVVDIEVERPNSWLPDETIANLHQRFRLQYHSLTERYVVTNVNSGERRSVTSRTMALDYAGTIRALPIIDRSLLEAGIEYDIRLRARLDLESLPAPLRLWGYVSGDWRLTSQWLEIPL